MIATKVNGQAHAARSIRHDGRPHDYTLPWDVSSKTPLRLRGGLLRSREFANVPTFFSNPTFTTYGEVAYPSSPSIYRTEPKHQNVESNDAVVRRLAVNITGRRKMESFLVFEDGELETIMSVESD